MDKNEESAFHPNAILKDPINVSSLFCAVKFFFYYSSALFSGLLFYALSDEPMSYESDVLLMEIISSLTAGTKMSISFSKTALLIYYRLKQN